MSAGIPESRKAPSPSWLRPWPGLPTGLFRLEIPSSLCRDQKYFESIRRDIAEAKYSVHFETFLWEEGKASDLVVEMLSGAAKRGAKVRVLTDARGSSKMGSKTKDALREAGCHFQSFHP